LINYYAKKYPELNISLTNPGLLNDYLKKLPNNSGYSPDNDVNFAAIERYTKERVFYFGKYDIDDYPSEDVWGIANSLIELGRPIMFKFMRRIKKRDGRFEFRPHFILAVGKCGSKYVIVDPAGGIEGLYEANESDLIFKGVRIFY